MLRQATACDVCGEVKKENNHWFKIRETKAGVIFASAKTSKAGKDVCGQVCAHKLLDRWLSTGTIEAQEPVANIEPLCNDEGVRG